jgi:hypothetical protein
VTWSFIARRVIGEEFFDAPESLFLATTSPVSSVIDR